MSVASSARVPTTVEQCQDLVAASKSLGEFSSSITTTSSPQSPARRKQEQEAGYTRPVGIGDWALVRRFCVQSNSELTQHDIRQVAHETYRQIACPITFDVPVVHCQAHSCQTPIVYSGGSHLHAVAGKNCRMVQNICVSHPTPEETIRSECGQTSFSIGFHPAKTWTGEPMLKGLYWEGFRCGEVKVDAIRLASADVLMGSRIFDVDCRLSTRRWWRSLNARPLSGLLLSLVDATTTFRSRHAETDSDRNVHALALNPPPFPPLLSMGVVALGLKLQTFDAQQEGWTIQKWDDRCWDRLARRGSRATTSTSSTSCLNLEPSHFESLSDGLLKHDNQD
ncbi:hypothetical protein BKA70DRAFT_1220343 [Coprinopsis sp. MPI-PUGE-AT-0042]|nr:hypothetical protein BKA70DRAFT_1220343 [Coprinopsis sp. MPI-PUGE-AT-0042]